MASQVPIIESMEGQFANSALIQEKVEHQLPASVDLDADWLRAKYVAEKEKRIKSEGLDQYRHVRGTSLMKYMDDAYVDPGFTREPKIEEHEIVILGGGFGGLLVAARLIDAGFEDVHIIEKAADFGGVW